MGGFLYVSTTVFALFFFLSILCMHERTMHEIGLLEILTICGFIVNFPYLLSKLN